jgi:hypothetical protein
MSVSAYYREIIRSYNRSVSPSVLMFHLKYPPAMSGRCSRAPRPYRQYQQKMREARNA